MTSASTRRRGQGRGHPLIMLAALIAVWTGARVMLWEAPIDFSRGFQDLAGPVLAAREIPTADRITPPVSNTTASDSAPDHTTTLPMLPDYQDWSPEASPNDHLPPPLWGERSASELGLAPATAAGHQLIWMAAMAHLPVPKEIADRAKAVSPAIPQALGANDRLDRWSLDSWVLWREGSNGALVSAGRLPTYGASQVGAVLRYRLDPRSERNPNAYMRVYRALIDNGESEVALGASVRPLADVPLRAHAELRATRFSNDTELRPSAFVTTELPPMSLPLGTRAELYAQGGYVAGDESTAFVDAQLHLLRDVKQFDLGRLSVGAASWGGAQSGAERVDVGPSARLDLTLGEIPARISLDYRERVAGDAEPASGVAVILSTRF